MFSTRHIRKVSWPAAVWVTVLLLGVVYLPRSGLASGLDELIAKAKQEGNLSATVTSSITGRTTPKLAEAFKKRFKLDIGVILTPVEDTTNYPRAIAETRIGAVPTYDAIEGSVNVNAALIGAGGVQNLVNWELLLAEINPLVRNQKVRAEQMSPPPYSGYTFEYISRVKSILYNPQLVSRADLPRSHVELSDPKYKGRWVQPPWASHWDIGPFVYPEFGKEKWLEIVRKAGKNAGAVMSEAAGVERVLLGEFAFTLANTYYAFAANSKDPQAPIEITYFKDYNQANSSFYVVRKGARHPAAATLFVLWMTTPEAESIWQAEIFATQYKWGESELDKKDRKLIHESGARIVELAGTKEGRDFLSWFGTEEGRKFGQAVGKAIRGE